MYIRIHVEIYGFEVVAKPIIVRTKSWDTPKIITQDKAIVYIIAHVRVQSKLLAANNKPHYKSLH